MRRTTTLLAIMVWGIAALASAQLSKQFADFPTSPAGFLLTDSEKKTFSQLKIDADAQNFIDLFWAKRDTNPETLVNEFKVDFEQRVKFADEKFSTEKHKGSLSDRGKVLILFGKVIGRQIVAPEYTQEELNLPDAMRRGPSEVWTFNRPGAKKPDEVISFVFGEKRIKSNDYIFQQNDRRTRDALKVLAEMPERLIVSPKLTEVPRLGLVTGSKAATSVQLAVFDTQPRPWPEGASVFATTGVASESLHPLWIHVELPDTVGAATQAIGRLRKAENGEAAGSFAAPISAMTIAGGRGYEVSLPVEGGSWKVDIALQNETGPVAITTIDAINEAVPAESDAVYFSPLYISTDVKQEAERPLGAPFNVGGWHVIPRSSLKLQPSESLAYFFLVTKPGLDEQGNPKFLTSLKLSIDGKPAGERPFEPVPLSKISPTVFMFGTSLPLQGFAKVKGDVGFEFTFKDSIKGVSRTTKVVITLPGEAPAAAAPAVKQ